MNSTIKHIEAIQDTGVTENVIPSVIEKLVKLVDLTTLDSTTNLSGKIHSDYAFKDSVDKIVAKYPNLTIDFTYRLMRMTDNPELLAFLIAHYDVNDDGMISNNEIAPITDIELDNTVKSFIDNADLEYNNTSNILALMTLLKTLKGGTSLEGDIDISSNTLITNINMSNTETININGTTDKSALTKIQYHSPTKIDIENCPLVSVSNVVCNDDTTMHVFCTSLSAEFDSDNDKINLTFNKNCTETDVIYSGYDDTKISINEYGYIDNLTEEEQTQDVTITSVSSPNLSTTITCVVDTTPQWMLDAVEGYGIPLSNLLTAYRMLPEMTYAMPTNTSKTKTCYLVGDGASYIITQFLPKTDFEIKLIGLFHDVSSTSTFGSMGKTNDATFTFDIFTLYSAPNGAIRTYWTNSYPIKAVADTKYTIDMFQASATLNGSAVSMATGTGSTRTGYLPLFGNCNSGTSYSALGKASISSCQCYQSGVLKQFFVPSKQDGAYGMFDLVEGKFYANQGTGSFSIEVTDD